jgi:hypothetical protein
MKRFLKQNISGLLLLFITITVIIIIVNYANWTMSESTYLYIFSTIAQSFAALIGLLATFVIFMITNIDNKRSDIGKIIIDLYTKYKPGRYPSPLKLGDYYMEKDIRPNLKELNIDDYNDLFDDYKRLNSYRKYLIGYSIYPLILLTLIFIVSLISFCFTSYLICNIQIGREYSTGLITISIASVIEMIIFIIKVIYRATYLDKEKKK